MGRLLEKERIKVETKKKNAHRKKRWKGMERDGKPDRLKQTNHLDVKVSKDIF